MTTKTTTRRFMRDPRSQIGFQSPNRASTDAINALEQWKLKVIDRAYQVRHDTDNELVAILTIDARDTTAGADLDAECVQCGVIHVVLASA